MVEGRERLGEGWFKLDEKVNRMDDFGDDDEGAEKDGERWKERSKRIIETEVVSLIYFLGPFFFLSCLCFRGAGDRVDRKSAGWLTCVCLFLGGDRMHV